MCQAPAACLPLSVMCQRRLKIPQPGNSPPKELYELLRLRDRHRGGMAVGLEPS